MKCLFLLNTLSYEYGRWGEIPNPGEMITRLNESWPRSMSPFAIALPIIVGKTGIQFDNWDSCYKEIIDVSDSFWGYEGLGVGYYSLGRSYSTETFFPVYYAFPDDTAGTPIDFDSLRQLVTSVPAHEQAAFQVYPNPFEAKVYLEGLPPQQSITAEIFDGMGRLVFQENLPGNSLDLGQFPAGVYVLQVKAGNILLGQRRIVKR